MTKRGHSHKPYDQAGLERLAMHYVARYATTETKLHAYLIRKARPYGGEVPSEDVPDAIPRIVEKMVDLGFVNDALYGETRTNALLRRGYGARRISGDLQRAGIPKDSTSALLDSAPISTQEAAQIYARRRRLGPYSNAVMTPEGKQRFTATLLRAGHQYDDVRELIEEWRLSSCEEK